MGVSAPGRPPGVLKGVPATDGVAASPAMALPPGVAPAQAPAQASQHTFPQHAALQAQCQPGTQEEEGGCQAGGGKR